MRRDRVLQVWMGERKVGTLAETPEHLDTIFQMGGSSGGARPKIYYELDGEEWIETVRQEGGKTNPHGIGGWASGDLPSDSKSGLHDFDAADHEAARGLWRGGAAVPADVL